MTLFLSYKGIPTMTFKWSVIVLSVLGHISIAHADSFDHEYIEWNAIVKKNVHWLADNVQSRVDYAKLKQDTVPLTQALNQFSAVTQTEFNRWSKDQQMAFLINAYNAFTIELILTKYPKLLSIKDLGSLFESPWKRKFFTLLGAKRHLDWIEHEMLRARYQDPRIHTAIVCASIGCPALNSEAYTAMKLNRQLEDGMRRFISDKTRNRYHDGKLEVSAIFKWFRADFEKGDQGFKSIADVFARYAQDITADPQVQAKIHAKSVAITFLEYDWSLNDTAR